MLHRKTALLKGCAAALASGLAAAPASVQAAPAARSTETSLAVDLEMYGAIRREGFEHSRVMDYATALMDGIGPRLTGSPNLVKAAAWARDAMAAAGLSRARLEDWGEFGTGWEQVSAWARMTAPDTQPLWLQAAPWSAPTPGPVTASVAFVDPDHLTAADLEALKGTLKGKIVLLGALPITPQITQPLSHRHTAQALKDLEQVDGPGDDTNVIHSRKGAALKLLRTEGVAAIIEPSRDVESGGGTGLIIDDNFADIANEPWNPVKASPIPHAVLMAEHYGRLARLVGNGAAVTVQLDIGTRKSGDHEHGFNVLAEIPGTDPKVGREVVLAGAHLDSWAAGTGATDNGAGVVVGIEAMRILKAAGLQPRRTIRLALWTGEEQGLFGSRGYVRDHLATFAELKPQQSSKLPPWLQPHGPAIPKPDWAAFDAYFNLDAGSGRIRGIYTGGDLAAAAIFRSWIGPLEDLGVTTVTTRRGQGSDQEAFEAADLPAFAFLQDPLDYETRAHHSNLDTLERLDEADLKQAAIVEAVFLMNAAGRDTMLPRRRR